MEPLQAWEPPRWSLEPTVDALSLTLVLVFLGYPPCALAMTSCKLDEYPVGDHCCPKCRPGYRVKEACRGSRTTLCASCTEGTFTAHLNGLNECLQCRVCDPDMGLVIRQKCSSTANTVCGCARGHFCVSDSDQCAECRQHSVCRPGQRVQAAGTEHRDTVCEDCPPGTFSPNGTLVACQPWTQSVPLSVALASTVLHPRHQLCLHPLSSPSQFLSPVGCLSSPGLSCPPSHTPPRLPAAAGPAWGVWQTWGRPRAAPSPAFPLQLAGAERSGVHRGAVPTTPHTRRSLPRCRQAFQMQAKPGTNSMDATCSSLVPWILLFSILFLLCVAAAFLFVRKRPCGGSAHKRWLSQGNRQQAEGHAAAVQTQEVTQTLPDVTTVAVEETASMFPKGAPTDHQWLQAAAT